MYIPKEVKDKILEIPILRLAGDLGLSVRRRSALCFMHEDKHPSLTFTPSKNTWKCYVCNKGGDQITLVMEKLGLPYIDACKWIADKYGIIIPEDDGYRKRVSTKKAVQQKPARATVSKLADTEMLTWIVNHAGLSDIAKKFLFETRKYKPEVVEQLRIGSISDASRLVQALINTFGQERALASGIVRKNSRGLYLFYCTPCLIFPYTDKDGNVVNLQSRYLGDNKKTPRFQFLSGVDTGIFNMQVLNNTSRTEKLFISEGVTDCIALLSAGQKAVAIPSATLLKQEDVRYLASKNLFMYPDSDEPGNKLFDELSKSLRDNYSYLTRMTLPDGFKDYSEYYLSLQTSTV